MDHSFAKQSAFLLNPLRHDADHQPRVGVRTQARFPLRFRARRALALLQLQEPLVPQVVWYFTLQHLGKLAASSHRVWTSELVLRLWRTAKYRGVCVLSGAVSWEESEPQLGRSRRSCSLVGSKNRFRLAYMGSEDSQACRGTNNMNMRANSHDAWQVQSSV